MSDKNEDDSSDSAQGCVSSSSSYSYSETFSPVHQGDVCSSPLSNVSGESSDLIAASPNNTCISPSSSPIQQRGVKRSAYASYKDNPSELIPRQTLVRWEKKRLGNEDPQSNEASGSGRVAIHEDQAEVDNQEREDEEKIRISEDQVPLNEVVSHNWHSSPKSSKDDQPCQDSPSSSLSYTTNDELDARGGELRGEYSDVGEVLSASSLECDVDELESDDESGDFNDPEVEHNDSSDPEVEHIDFSSDSEVEHSDLSDNSQNESSLYPGCEKSRDEAVYELLNIYVRNNLSKTALKDVLQFYNSSLPTTHNMPRTIHCLFKYIESLSIPMDEVQHFYCRPAKHAVQSKDTPCECGSNDIGVFYELSLERRLKFLFEHCGLADLIDKYSEERNQRQGTFVCDVLDGTEYSRIWLNVQSKYRLTLMINTDGVCPHKSSKAKMWPLMFTIMEIPPQLRSFYTVVWGVWFDKSLKPDMNLFLKPFVDSLIKIHHDNGISWHHPSTGSLHVSPVLAPLIIADAPARAGVRNMQEHQAKYACNACEQKTNKLPAPPAVVGKKRKIRKRRFLFKEEPAELRTHESMVNQGRHAQNGAVPKKGFKGPSVVSDLPLLDMSTCVVAEYMHCVLLGVVKQICSMWFFEKGDWYVGKHLEQINNFLCKEIHPPDFVARLPRSLDYFQYFKANEFRSFLLYYSVIVVFPYLGDKYFQHWLLLVEAVFLLLSECISEDNFVSVEALLRLFVRDVGVLYGNEQYTYNVHQLNHLALYARRWGCLWSTSAFGFEDFNGTLSKMIHGSKYEGRELLNSMFLAQGKQLLKTKVMNKPRQIGNISLGKPVSHSLTEAESLCLERFNALAGFTFYARILIGREVYTSLKYQKNLKRNNSFVEVQHNGQKKFGSIIVYCKFDLNFVCLVSVHRVVHTKFFFHRDSRVRIKHIIPVERTEEILACDVKNITQKLIQVGDYLCFRPNTVEGNVL